MAERIVSKGSLEGAALFRISAASIPPTGGYYSLKRKGVTYAQLVGLLADQGVMDSEPNIRNKISRGKFTAVFLVQCLQAIGVKEVRL